MVIEEVNRWEKVYTWNDNLCVSTVEMLPRLEKAISDDLLPWVVDIRQGATRIEVRKVGRRWVSPIE